MIIGILKEPAGENRVAMLPEQLVLLVKQGIEVMVEKDAGANAFANNELYVTAGATVTNRNTVLSSASILLSYWSIPDDELAKTQKGVILIGVFQPLFNFQLMKAWASNGFTVFSLDMIPRTTRAQSMDVLSSQANIAGYKAVLKAANLLPRYFPMFMTAAGSIPPAKLMVLGAGVAGLQAVATAKRLGAVVEVSDTRPAVKEEVMSLGAKFIEVDGAADASAAGGYAVEQTEEFKQKQKERLALSVAKSDVIIATAQLQGKPAPLLIDENMLKTMKPGAVVVDLAASTGGNVFGVQNNATIQLHGVTLVGNSQLASDMPADASKVYGKNMFNFLQLILTKEGAIHLNFEDDIVKGCCMAHGGAVVNDRIQSLLAS
ncbi:MAG: NAD(P) transhydrogenase subunit alpha [Sphingobacteriia bacterium 24-36-13]|jgi:NAD(P) transhydrogenase subunit alpha|uniref:NAD(P) transhydrogenase subunit alpha n=1 Tax=Sediminibacterium sp. TaxID=1917865 RepID=UPI000BD4F5B8|nr:NAD(P) transhydrogenase subunit alpha [Sediminibacterium sp.]OYY11547.1 MAG: NAD(P) transhydrogenase subunit alpha [Sphingobacteriia bacterium 35-36-14]OYZ54938.1 MAG: NAD(P) transhydrogenase subunit alpha [Sphingobacteriia bacterium 24-36-13]OZA66114.1 MAG: NAD(P) transhydrogenase subunit alpha [Sphingobacteriia bacterium 39-36-14]MBT9484532.1 NAD(P) transhydrogenase subunit alpha [Sediminibacterium sp.]HQS23990.1 NAD(P) transhydrogenase subunit alpha [Sediminibacterium sp.]